MYDSFLQAVEHEADNEDFCFATEFNLPYISCPCNVCVNKLENVYMMTYGGQLLGFLPDPFKALINGLQHDGIDLERLLGSD